MPRFSVIVPTYNRASLLPRCLESVLAQAFLDYELIVVDDGSTDETAGLVEAIAGRDARVRYVRQKHKGAGHARNRGAALAAGDFVLFLDSDDAVLPSWLTAFAEALQCGGLVACCGIVLKGAPKVPGDAGNGERLGGGAVFLSGTYAVQRSVFLQLGGFLGSLPANQHSELRCRLVPWCERRDVEIVRIPLVLVRAHDHEGPRIRNNVDAILSSGRFVLQEHAGALRRYPSTYSAWATATGGCAARLNDYVEARHWFRQAIRITPMRWKNYVRLLVTYAPGLRSLVWTR